VILFGYISFHSPYVLIQYTIIQNHRSKPTTSKQFSILYICKYVTFLYIFLLLINCKYMVCSRRCIVVTIDGASYDVDVENIQCTVWHIIMMDGRCGIQCINDFLLHLQVRKKHICVGNYPHVSSVLSKEK
jgi:hypothetical protein